MVTRHTPEMKTSPEKTQQEAHKEKKSALNSEGLRSLSDYYQIKKLPATRFLSALKKNKVVAFHEDDVKHCLEGLDDNDAEFAKTLDLIYCAASTQSPLAKQCITFAWQACRQQLVRHYRTDPDLTKATNEMFADIFHALKPGFTGKKTDHRSVNLSKAVGIWASHHRNLDEAEAVGFLTSELIHEKASKDGRNLKVFDVLFRPLNKITAMTDMLRVAEIGLIKAQHAREAMKWERQQRENESRRAQAYLDELTLVNAQLGSKEDEVADLRAKLKDSEDEKAVLEQELEQQHAIRLHGVSELKGRFRVFLEKKVTPLIVTAHEFAELNPPRSNIVVERLEMVSEEMRREMEWLRSTD